MAPQTTGMNANPTTGMIITAMPCTRRADTIIRTCTRMNVGTVACTMSTAGTLTCPGLKN